MSVGKENEGRAPPTYLPSGHRPFLKYDRARDQLRIFYRGIFARESGWVGGARAPAENIPD